MDNITSLKDLMNDVEEYVLKNNSIYLILCQRFFKTFLNFLNFFDYSTEIK